MFFLLLTSASHDRHVTRPFAPHTTGTHRLHDTRRLFALRLLGIFLILPVFSVWAQTLEGGTNAFMVGMALGIYGLTQAVLQIPFGAASDRFGRKPVIVTGLLIFIAGSLLAYSADNITTLLIARAIQGAGAVSAAVTAMISDSVREQLLTRAMAFVGASIGVSFTFSLVISPILADSIGVPGIFLLTALLCMLAIGAVLMLPTAPVKDLKTSAPAPNFAMCFCTAS